ncbi:low-density liporeceptor-related 2-like protein 2 [Sarcoptes scabiei]|uniref:Low-density liporeceptor-related 2-like protein 2 n=1 Tax=Sarcoptes scabiei TaxID=52283 RepID=A0A132A637_SARSC|nr:low-density liporeceptor-related 2-like protein 2 [Sarcoptes scabiei]
MNENARDSDEKSYPMKSSNDPNQMNEGGSSVEYQPGDHNGHPRYDDPSDRTCSEGQFMCRKVSPDQPHVRCIPNDWRCNGVRDCEESDDEEQCDSDSLQTGHYSHMHSSYSQSHHHHQQHQMDPYGQHQKISEQSSCEPNQYQCYGTGVHDTPAKCIDRSLLCDKNNDCAYGDDERMCQDGKYVGEQQEQYRQGGAGEMVSGGGGGMQASVSYQSSQYGQGGQYYGGQSGQQPPAPGQSEYYHSQQQQQQSPPSPDQSEFHRHSSSSQNRPGGGSYDDRNRHPSSGSDRRSDDQACRGGRSEEYIRRLEFLDRCYRSCIRHQFTTS